jgi:CheY-like chemotaxis protein
MSQFLLPTIIVVALVALLGGAVYFGRAHRARQSRLADEHAREHSQRAERRRRRQAALDKPSPVITTDPGEILSKVPRGRASSVLLVEDSPTTLLALRKILERWNYRVTTAADGRQAWAEMQRAKPDLVISDIDMPEMTGLELLQLMRADLVLLDVPVILITGSARLHLQAGQQAGVNGLLAKPFEDKVLIDQIRYILQE